jgi:hypothetical protein
MSETDYTKEGNWKERKKILNVDSEWPLLRDMNVC